MIQHFYRTIHEIRFSCKLQTVFIICKRGKKILKWVERVELGLGEEENVLPPFIAGLTGMGHHNISRLYST